MKNFRKRILLFWYRKSLLAYFLVPFSWLFRGIIYLRLTYYQRFSQRARFSMPVVVVGNISLGGTGKTPFVAWLVNQLEQQGFQPGVVMRGFQGKLKANQAMTVIPTTSTSLVGDEPVLLAEKCSCPVVVGKDRVKAVRHLIDHFPKINIIVSDDGLQHYALARDIEIVIIDGCRQLGNGFCLPAGPLREPPSRLAKVDFVITNQIKKIAQALQEYQANSWVMMSQLTAVYRVANPKITFNLDKFIGQTVHAVAGIGNPEKFFLLLKEKGIQIIEHYFEDHYEFKEQDLIFEDNLPIFMTEKDAIKCRTFTANVSELMWAVPLEVYLPQQFTQNLICLLERKNRHGQKIA